MKIYPSAQGFGTDTIAGRGGRVIRVTNLDDGGPGSLRAAMRSNGPRCIVFEVAGIIHLAESLFVAEPFLSVYGQTAPWPGITIRGGTVRIQAHDVLLQHLTTSSSTTAPFRGQWAKT